MEWPRLDEDIGLDRALQRRRHHFGNGSYNYDRAAWKVYHYGAVGVPDIMVALFRRTNSVYLSERDQFYYERIRRSQDYGCRAYQELLEEPECLFTTLYLVTSSPRLIIVECALTGLTLAVLHPIITCVYWLAL